MSCYLEDFVIGRKAATNASLFAVGATGRRDKGVLGRQKRKEKQPREKTSIKIDCER